MKLKASLLSLAAAAALVSPVLAGAMHWSDVTVDGGKYCVRSESGEFKVRFKSQSGMGQLINDPSSAQTKYCVVQSSPL